MRKRQMNDELLAQIEREVLGWDGVSRRGIRLVLVGSASPATGPETPETGGAQIGHIHDDGHADFRFPREVRDELIRTGKAIPHPAFPDSRTTASYRVQELGRCGRSPGAVPHELRAQEETQRSGVESGIE